MSEDNEWSEYREAQRERRAERLPKRIALIMRLKEFGFQVDKKTEYQYRINETLDLYPIHHRFHNIKTNKRGGYKHLTDIVNCTFDTNIDLRDKQ